ncbi:hypothetical protein [Maribacter sp. HTCC2170]|uniref:hypothetical protein n=1 Tax=Maribacter sp. (strain HTCC2170 / KCCM 42371) TaxID=313603 RepID=UPI0002E9B21B|nr:hypothetical protein [Maribacter sp. HTCC2170]
MSGSGHLQDMNNRIRQNRPQPPSKRPKFKDHNRESIYSQGDKYKGTKFKKVSEDKLAEIKPKEIVVKNGLFSRPNCGFANNSFYVNS